METGRVKRLSYTIILGIVLMTAFVLAQPGMQASFAQVTEEGAPDYKDCRFFPGDQAKDTWSMNTVRIKDVAKTIIAEKEIFRCKTVQGEIPLILDVTTVAEIYENMTTKSIIHKQAEVISCAKLSTITTTGGPADGDGTVLGCDVYTPETDFIPVSNCTKNTDNYLEHPQEMNTVNKGNTVKTIIVQKEVFFCKFSDDFDPDPADSPNDKQLQQYIIEEIWEDLSLLPDNPVVQKNVESLRCWTLTRTAFVESCQFRTLPLQEFIPEE